MLKVVYKSNFDGVSNEVDFRMVMDNILKDNNYAIELYEKAKIANLNVPHGPIFCKCTEKEWIEILEKVKEVSE